MKPDTKHNIRFLSDIPQKNNFEVPKGYFKNVGQTLSSIIYLQQINTNSKQNFNVPKGYLSEIESLVISKLKAEKLHPNTPKHTGTPENYFETLEDRVMERLPKQHRTIRLKTILKRTFTPIAVAASILLLVTLGNINKVTAVTFDTITNSDIESWVDNGYLVFNSEDFTEQVTDTALELDNFSNIYNDEQALNFLQETTLENILFHD